MEHKIKNKILIGLIAALLPAVALAVNITVPAAPGSGYFLYSTSTGAYVYHSSSTAATDFGITSSQWTTTSTGIFYNGGRVGIGTSSPDHALTVSGNGHFTQGLYVDNANNGTSTFLGAATFGGNVGIGTTTPTVPLQVYGAGYFGASAAGGRISLGANSSNDLSIYNDGSNQRLNFNGAGNVLFNYGYSTAKTFNFYTNSSSSPVMSLLNTGGVAIGTSTAPGLLTVNGQIQATNIGALNYAAGDNIDLTGNNIIISAYNGSGSYFAIKTRDGNNAVVQKITIPNTGTGVGVGASTPDAFLTVSPGASTTTSPLFDVYTSSSYPGIYINNAGNVGIGTSTPASLLVVNGTTTLPKIAPNSFLATNGSSQIIATSTPSSGGTPAGTSTSVQFNNNGSFGGDNNFTYSSSSKNAALSASTSSLSIGLVQYNGISSSTVIIVGAGGGGASYNTGGGAGGGLTGTAGPTAGTGVGGGGGTQTAGGTASGCATAGSIFQGGAGCAAGGAAGGGGGGWFGGGGGYGPSSGAGGGGGGGSSYIKSTLTATSTSSGVVTGSGFVTFATTTSVTFTATGTLYAWTVPSGVSSVTITVGGGAGGNFPSQGQTGGYGGVATGTLAVSPGDILYYEVGGNAPPTSSNGVGGVPGGGNGSAGAGGGGYSFVAKSNNSQSNPTVNNQWGAFISGHIETGSPYSTAGGITSSTLPTDAGVTLSPIISSCGTATVAGNDTASTITVVGSAISSCTLTFIGQFYPAVPSCSATIVSSTAAYPYITSLSTSSITYGFSPSIGAGAQVNSICLGYYQ